MGQARDTLTLTYVWNQRPPGTSSSSSSTASSSKGTVSARGRGRGCLPGSSIVPGLRGEIGAGLEGTGAVSQMVPPGWSLLAHSEAWSAVRSVPVHSCWTQSQVFLPACRARVPAPQRWHLRLWTAVWLQGTPSGRSCFRGIISW